MPQNPKGTVPVGGKLPDVGQRFNQQNEEHFRNQVLQRLQRLADQISEMQKRTNRSLVAGVLDKTDAGHYQISTDLRTEDATFAENADGHFSIDEDRLDGARLIQPGDHFEIEV